MLKSIVPRLFRSRTKTEVKETQAEKNEPVEAVATISPWPQVCFLHLQKTAGSSINELFRKRLSDTTGIGIACEYLDPMPPRALQHKPMVSAHFSIRHLPLLADHRFIFTFLREPVDRVISNYYYLRRYDGDVVPTNSEVLHRAKTKNLHDFLLDEHPQVQSFTTNMQAHTLAWEWRGGLRKNFRDLGQTAINSLQQMDYVGFFEQYEESLHELFEKLHWRLNPNEHRVTENKTPQRPAVSDIEPQTLDLIRELNQADQQLYDFAVKNLMESNVQQKAA